MDDRFDGAKEVPSIASDGSGRSPLRGPGSCPTGGAPEGSPAEPAIPNAADLTLGQLLQTASISVPAGGGRVEIESEYANWIFIQLGILLSEANLLDDRRRYEAALKEIMGAGCTCSCAERSRRLACEALEVPRV